jgi:hypothetical protein
MQCLRYPYRNGFLSNSTEPLTDFSLPQQYEHFFLDHPRQQQPAIQVYQFVVGIRLSLKLHGSICSTNLQVVWVIQAGNIHKKSHREVA